MISKNTAYHGIYTLYTPDAPPSELCKNVLQTAWDDTQTNTSGETPGNITEKHNQGGE